MKSLCPWMITMVCFLLIETTKSQDVNSFEQFRAIDNALLDEVIESANTDSANVMQLFSIAQYLDHDSLLAISYNWLGIYLRSKGDPFSFF